MEDIDKLKQIIAAGLGPQLAGKTQYAVMPDDYSLLDLDVYQDQPRRIVQHLKFEELESMLAYLGNHGDTTQTAVFATMKGTNIVAVLDYHAVMPVGEKYDKLPQPQGRRPGDLVPSHCSHWCEHRLIYSDEWKAWTTSNKKTMSQSDFVRFLEANGKDIIEPQAAAILEMAQGLKGKRTAEFTTERNIANGAVELSYQQTVQDATTRGGLEVPDKFAIGIPVYDWGVGGYKLTARLRYRVEEGRLTVKYEFDRTRETELMAFKEVVALIEEAGYPVYIGVRS